jgi:hypothetical protein
MTSDKPHQDSRTALDENARSAHAASLGRLSPRVQAQLAQRRRAALMQNTRTTGLRAWPMLALGSAGALTLAVGLFILQGNNAADVSKAPSPVVTVPATDAVPMVDTTPDATAPVIAQVTPAATPRVIANRDAPEIDIDTVYVEDDALPAELLAAEFDTTNEIVGFDTLEENPDFYLWLASEEAQADMTESL